MLWLVIIKIEVAASPIVNCERIKSAKRPDKHCDRERERERKRQRNPKRVKTMELG